MLMADADVFNPIDLTLGFISELRSSPAYDDWVDKGGLSDIVGCVNVEKVPVEVLIVDDDVVALA